jgi:hypothetical protein
MKQITFLLVAVAALAGVVAISAPAPLHADGVPAPVFVTQIPPGYRDWRLISVAHEEGNLHSFAAVLGNDAAIKAYRDGKLPFPDGSIIAALHYSHVSSEENNKVFGRSQAFVPGAPTNVQFMVKDSKKHATTGGWGFAHFNKDGKPGDEASNENLLPLPQSNQGSRPCLHALRTVISRITSDRSYCHDEAFLLDSRHGSHLRRRRACIRSGRRRRNARFEWRGGLAQLCSVEQ